ELVDRDRHGLPLHPQPAELTEGEAVGTGAARRLAHHEVGAEDLVRSLEAGGQVDRVPHDREVEALLRSPVADAPGARDGPDPPPDRREAVAGALLAERRARLLTAQGRIAGVRWMLVQVERRVPERDDGVPLELVDDATGVEDEVRAAREVVVQERH